jgi:hypothetical protein
VLKIHGDGQSAEIFDPKPKYEPEDSDREKWTQVPPPAQGGHLSLLDGPQCNAAEPPAWCHTVLAVGYGTSEIFDPQAGEVGAWTPTEPLPVKGEEGEVYPRETVRLDGEPCSQTGSGAPPEWCGTVLAVAKDFAFVYDPKAGSSDLVGEWKRVGAFQITRSKFSLTSLNNGRVLAVGGTNEDTDDPFDRAATAELFEPVEDDTDDGEWNPGESGWEKIAELNDPRSEAESAFLPDQDGDGRGRVLVMGGESNKTLDDLDTCALASAEVFDPRGDGGDSTEPVFLDAGNMTQ